MEFIASFGNHFLHSRPWGSKIGDVVPANLLTSREKWLDKSVERDLLISAHYGPAGTPLPGFLPSSTFRMT